MLSEMKPGALAKAAGVSVDTLHHYERLGLLIPERKRENGYREYSAEACDRVRLIRNALRIGFSLRELSSVLAMRDEGDAPCREVYRLADRKLRELDRQIADLLEMKSLLSEMLDQWRQRLGSAPEGTQARLLDHIPEAFPTFDGKVNKTFAQRSNK